MQLKGSRSSNHKNRNLKHHEAMLTLKRQTFNSKVNFVYNGDSNVETAMLNLNIFIFKNTPTTL